MSKLSQTFARLGINSTYEPSLTKPVEPSSIIDRLADAELELGIITAPVEPEPKAETLEPSNG